MANQGPPSLKLTVPEVIISVQSLYTDELKPFGRVLLKRLRERAAAAVARAHGLETEAVDPETMPKIDPKRLRRICQTCADLQVHPEDGREFSVTLLGRPCSFLDVCSPHNPYPLEMWSDASIYFESLCKEEMHLPGGRYACARLLSKRGLPFLAGFSLGQLCHVVQLAISNKRILGYLGGQLVPYQHSEEWVKEQHAFHQQPICSKKGAASGNHPVATWEEAHEGLRELLNTESNPEPGIMTLSNVKRLFRSRFQLELSETALGHSRLFDLLQDLRFRDVCFLQSHKNGQLLVKRTSGPQRVPCHQLTLPGAAGLHFAAQPQLAGAESVTAPGAVAGCELWSTVFMGSIMYPSASMQVNASPPKLAALRQIEFDLGMDCRWQGLSTQGPGCSLQGTPQEDIDPSCKKRSEDSDQSTDMPQSRELAGSSSDEGRGTLSSLALQAEAIRAEEEENTGASLKSLVAHEVYPVRSGCEHLVKNTFIEIPSPTNFGARRRLRSVPK